MKKFFLFLFVILFFVILFVLFENMHQQKPTKLKIQGVILPHHTLAKEILNNSFKTLKENISPDVIVIYGTNHYFPISDTYTTTTEIKNEFNLDNVLADNTRIEKDHSIQTILTYINQYFTNVRVIPIIVSARYQNIEDLNKNVRKFINVFGYEKTLYIASVDFAHNVSLEEGLNKNKESINSISNFNYGEILRYNDDHLDSPLAMITFLLTMQGLGATSWQLWYSSHGALITNLLDLESTSYVVGSFSN